MYSRVQAAGHKRAASAGDIKLLADLVDQIRRIAESGGRNPFGVCVDADNPISVTTSAGVGVQTVDVAEGEASRMPAGTAVDKPNESAC